MTDPVVRLRDVHLSYGDREVLHGLDLEVEPGERVSLIGPSGSGKSSVLRLVMGLVPPTSGRIEIAGSSMWHEGPPDRPRPASDAHVRRVRGHLGMVFQHFHLFPHLDVTGNVALGPRRVLGLSSAEADERAHGWLERVGLGDHLDARPAHLSGGQKQRVGIARALAMEPAVLLLDEITSGLDPELVGEVLQVVRELAVARQVTMLLVTHRMPFAREVSDRVVFMDAGRIVEVQPPDALFEHPREGRTQAFLDAVLGPA